MISIKRYLDHSTELEKALKAAYSSSLIAMGRSALQAHRITGAELQGALDEVGLGIEESSTSDGVARAQAEVAALLEQWGARTADHAKATAEEVKALLVAVAGTADAVGERDQTYADKLKDLTGRLESVAQLDDMVRMRRSIVESATELKKQIREMVESSESATNQFKLQIDHYASRLEESEQCTRRDSLTKVLNRRGIEAAMTRRLEDRRAFSLMMVDLNRFKSINDEYGHLAGDDLLQQFAGKLRSALRPADFLGRWGGDEFMLLLDGAPVDVALMTERVREATTGEYCLAVGKTTKKIMVQAAFGLANRKSGETAAELVARADRAMYMHKQDHQR
ncbi:MAG: GGDEF domain-containing protein [Acidobacteriaceae bacterium]